MTQNTDEKDKRNTEKLTEIVKWSLKNKKLWLKLCCTPEIELKMGEIQIILDECKQNQYMELYYLMLARMGCVMDICVNSPSYISFIQASSGYDIHLEPDSTS